MEKLARERNPRESDKKEQTRERREWNGFGNEEQPEIPLRIKIKFIHEKNQIRLQTNCAIRFFPKTDGTNTHPWRYIQSHLYMCIVVNAELSYLRARNSPLAWKLQDDETLVTYRKFFFLLSTIEIFLREILVQKILKNSSQSNRIFIEIQV